MKKQKIGKTEEEEVNHFKKVFTIEEINNTINILKLKKSVEVDYIMAEQINIYSK